MDKALDDFSDLIMDALLALGYVDPDEAAFPQQFEDRYKIKGVQ